MSSAPKEIMDLVARFEMQYDTYKSSQYKEAQVRQDFIDPLFKVLGWDMSNAQGFAEAYREVIHEDSLRIEGSVKAPDYAFRIGEVKKFIVEAKKPSVNLEDNPEPAIQLRTYAWNAKLPISILTDFEEFSVYDCRYEPKAGETPKVARILYLTFRDYIERWSDIENVFSKKAILQGSFDKYVTETKGKRGTKEVDEKFLEDITSWREILARNIALRNNDLNVEEMNASVQGTINRIVFLRICEDRGIEKYGQLQEITKEDGVYSRLKNLFIRADDRYNSGLFHFKEEPDRETPDLLMPNLKIDDKVLREVINGLYPPSPYRFDVISPEILGQVYEQFLGKVIRLTEGHHAKVEDKPEVKKAGGIYYTPASVVNYIVDHSVGKLLEGKTPREVEKIRILDPACGSGSFLLGAYRKLLSWHLDWWASHLGPLIDAKVSLTSPEIMKMLPSREDIPKKRSRKAKARMAAVTMPIYRASNGTLKLTIAERKRILLNNIYGVDIDTQAVEVTKLSLLLKVLEDESRETVQTLMRWSGERVLPDLNENIKCGNSLIDLDFFDDESDLNMEEYRRVRPFSWEREFPEIIQAGGFNCVIGNPPWGADLTKEDERYFSTKAGYQVSQNRSMDTYSLFIERVLELLKADGLLSYITPDTFLRKDDYLSTRKLLLNDTCILELLELGPLFRKVRDTWCSIFVVKKSPFDGKNRIKQKKINRFVVSVEERLDKFTRGEWDVKTEIPQAIWLHNHDMIIGYLASEPEQQVIAKIESNSQLGQLTDLYVISRGEEGSKFNIRGTDNGDFFMVIPENVERYAISDGVRILSANLTPTKIQALYTHPKIWIIRIQKMRWRQRIVSAFDSRTNSSGMKTLQMVVSPTDNIPDLKYLQAILSSKLMNFWCVNYLADDMNKSYLQKSPVYTINPTKSADIARRDQIVAQVNKITDIHKRLSECRVNTDRELLDRQLETIDEQINHLIYALYGLTEEEIKIIEG